VFVGAFSDCRGSPFVELAEGCDGEGLFGAELFECLDELEAERRASRTAASLAVWVTTSTG